MYQILGGIVTIAVSWGGVQAKMSALDSRTSEQEKHVQDLRMDVAALKASHAGLDSLMNRALDDLKEVTSKLEALAIKIAGGRG